MADSADRLTALPRLSNAASGPLGVIQQIVQAPDPPKPGESCEMCGEVLTDRHGHVADIQNRGIMCCCRGCWLLFTSDGSGGGRFRAVPTRVLSLGPLALTRQQWTRLQIPVNLAFLFHNSEMDQVVAFYPSPGGATESELSSEEWNEILEANPAIEHLAPDVEALLVRDLDDSFECFLVPVDKCYELVGHIRLLWKGFDGGQEVRARIDEFFSHVAAEARPVEEVTA